jgi:hypothetical protein
VDRTAGFAASLAIRQELVQSLVRVLYNAGRLDNTISVVAPTVSADLFVSLPVLTYPAGVSNRLAIDLYAWGPMTVTPPGNAAESRRVKFRARILVAQAISVMNGRLVFGLDTSSASIRNLQIDPYVGGLFSPGATAYLLSPEFQALVTLGLQAQLSAFGQLIPPLDISFLGAIAADPSTTVKYVTVEEALVLGLDISTGGLTTHGDASLLGDISGGNDIGMWTRPSAVPVAYADIRQKIEEQVVAQGATLDSFSLTVEEGSFLVKGSASETGGGVNFSVHAVPELVRHGECFEWDEEYGEHFAYCTPDREELWFDPQDVVVDVEKDWWVILLEALGGILTLGIGALVVESFVDMIRGNVASGINQNTPTRAERNQDFTINGVSRPPMRLRIEEFECHIEGVFIGLTITPQFWAGRLEGPTAISAEEALVETVRFHVDLPPDALADDPELRVRWTVRRTDTNVILISSDTVATAMLNLGFDQTAVPFLELDELSVEVRVYRTLGAGSEDLFQKLQYLRVVDYVDRSHPYVQWSHQSMVPLVRVEADGTHTILGNQVIGRRSAIHRTALPGRCRMLRFYSLTKLFPPDARGFPLEYLDTLPFPISDLIKDRAQVCDYCFFGGPTKDVPLVPSA